MSQSILTEAGTNELELLVFRVGKTPFGINVAKIREIIQPKKTISIPYAPSAVEGSLRVREDILTLVNLGRYLNMEMDEDDQNRMVVIVEFNNIRCGILVDEVQRIYRLKWEQVLAPSQYLIDLEAPITGTVNIEDSVVLVADFETIVGNILNIHSVKISPDSGNEAMGNENAHILLADDSSMVRTALEKNLRNKGFNNLTICTDGQHAWEQIQAHDQESDTPVDLVLSDIEMPRMDGFHLTAKIKEEARFNKVPVVLFSSLITPANLNKGISVGADAQISKPNGEELVNTINEQLDKAAEKNRTPALAAS